MKLARALPRFSELLTMEFVFSFGVICGVIVLLLPAYRIAMQKAELSRIMSVAGNEIPEHMLHMALTGETVIPDIQPASDRDVWLPSVGGRPVTKRIADGAIRYEGQGGYPFYLAFTPSVIAEGPIGSVIWLCGNSRAPLGWTQPAQPGTDLPPELIPSVCRD